MGEERLGGEQFDLHPWRDLKLFNQPLPLVGSLRDAKVLLYRTSDGGVRRGKEFTATGRNSS